MTETTKSKELAGVQPEPEPTRRDPGRLGRGPTPPTRHGRGPLVTIAAAVVVLVVGAVAAVLILDGDSGNDTISPSATTAAVPALQPDTVTSFEDIAGTYLRHGPGAPTYFRFFEDGTIHAAPDTNLIVNNPVTIYQTRFEGTKVFMTTASSVCDQPDQGGTYEIHVLEDGYLQFAAVDDDACPLRSAVLQGFGDPEATVEYEPVP